MFVLRKLQVRGGGFEKVVREALLASQGGWRVGQCVRRGFKGGGFDDGGGLVFVFDLPPPPPPNALPVSTPYALEALSPRFSAEELCLCVMGCVDFVGGLDDGIGGGGVYGEGGRWGWKMEVGGVGKRGKG